MRETGLLKPDLVFFLPDLSGGGAERVMLGIACAAFRRGYPSALVVGRRTGPLAAVIPEDLTVLSLDTREPWRMVWRFRRLLRARRPGAVLAALPPANVAAGLGRIGLANPPRLVLTEHNLRSTMFGRLGSSAGWLRRRSYALALRAADRVVAVSTGVAEDLASNFSVPRTEIDVVPNPIVSPDLLSAAERRPDHPWFRPSSDAPVVLGAGRLVPQKDFAMLLRAVALLNESVTVRLVILGAGPERQNLLDLREELGLTAVVDFPGWTPDPFAFMAHADIFVLCSAWEGFGNVLVEAMAFGTPVVSTVCEGGPSDILQGGRLGPLVPIGDPEALAAAIRRTLNEPIPSVELVRAARRFSYERIVPRYLALLDPEGTRRDRGDEPVARAGGAPVGGRS